MENFDDEMKKMLKEEERKIREALNNNPPHIYYCRHCGGGMRRGSHVYYIWKSNACVALSFLWKCDACGIILQEFIPRYDDKTLKEINEYYQGIPQRVDSLKI